MKTKNELILVKRGYFISEEGQAYNKYGEKVGYVNNVGYIGIDIRVNKKVIKISAHRLQAYQKYGCKIFDEYIEVRHLDGNKLNNSWKNICVGTRSENMMDIPKQIRIKKALYASSFVKKYDNDQIKEFHEINRSYKKTMDKFNISSKGTLNYILNN